MWLETMSKLLVLLLCYIVFNCANGESNDILTVQAGGDQTFFRRDYTFISSLNSFYKFHTIQRTWMEARKTCQREGATLFYADDENEVMEVINFWNKTQPFGWIHMGISSLVVKGVFETVDGKSLSSVYCKWRPGEPNDAGGAEDCVVMSRDDALFNDDNCDKPQPFICKKTLASLNWNVFCDLPDPEYKYDATLNSCYKFHLTPVNWTEAYAICSIEQSHLAIIDSQAEADYLIKLTANAPKDKVTGNYLRGAVHLGFHNRDMGGWRTIKGTPLSKTGYANWGATQPDGGDDELCGSMFYTGELNDIGCYQRMFFTCEHEIQGYNYDFRDLS